MEEKPVISVLCPTYNEAGYIENVLRFYSEALPEKKELFVIDGGSDDATVAIVEKWAAKDTSIHLLHNPHKYVPQALNIGLKNVTADMVVRLDAHTDYAPDYFEKIIATFRETGADIVGGPMRAKGKTTIQKAVAFATSGAFGIGNSKFHDESYKGFVDSVYLGAWKKEIFDEIGYFDERMKRNQDDELHYRAKSKGKKIYLNPDIKSVYYPRDSFAKLFKQYFQYGLYKPLVIKKIKSEVKLRHLIPAAFVLYLLLCLIIACKYVLLLLPLLLYLLIDLVSAFANKQPMKVKMVSLLVYPILHISYGTGFLLGIGKLLKK